MSSERRTIVLLDYLYPDRSVVPGKQVKGREPQESSNLVPASQITGSPEQYAERNLHQERYQVPHGYFRCGVKIRSGSGGGQKIKRLR